MADEQKPDVLCLQEIANNYPAPRLGGSRGENQFAELARLLPGYAPGFSETKVLTISPKPSMRVVTT